MVNFIFETLIDKESLWGVSLDTIFTTFITILIFIIGHILVRLWQNNKEKKRLRDIRIYFFTLLDTIPQAIDKLIKVYTELSNAIEERTHRNFVLGESHELCLDNVTKLSHVDLFKILISSSKARNDEAAFKHYKNIFDTFEFIRLQNDRVKTSFSYFMGEYRGYRNCWAEASDSILRFHDSILSFAKRNNIRPSEDPFLKEFDELFYAASKNRNFESMYEAEESLINPLKNLCKKYATDQRALMILREVLICWSAFKDIINLKVLYSRLFKDEADKLEQMKESLEEAILFFKSQYK
jgi:hypothetical protein